MSPTGRVSDSVVAVEQVGPTIYLTSGGQGEIHAVPGFKLNHVMPLAYKEYKPDWRKVVDWVALRSRVSFLAGLPASEGLWFMSRVAWPVSLVTRAKLMSGFLMPEVPDSFRLDFHLPSGKLSRPLAHLSYLLNGEKYMRNRGIWLPVSARHAILADAAETLRRLHSYGIAVGDFSPKNVLYTLVPAPACFFVDADGMRLRGRSAVAQAETPDWRITDVSKEELATPNSDNYKLALLVLRTLVGDQQVRSAAALPSGTPGPIVDLIKRGLSPSPLGRPSAEEWVGALRGAGASLGAPAPPAQPGRPATGPYKARKARVLPSLVAATTAAGAAPAKASAPATAPGGSLARTAQRAQRPAAIASILSPKSPAPSHGASAPPVPTFPTAAIVTATSGAAPTAISASIYQPKPHVSPMAAWRARAKLFIDALPEWQRTLAVGFGVALIAAFLTQSLLATNSASQHAIAPSPSTRAALAQVTPAVPPTDAPPTTEPAFAGDVEVTQGVDATIPAGYICAGDSIIDGLKRYDDDPSTGMYIVTTREIRFQNIFGTVVCVSDTAAHEAQIVAQVGSGGRRVDRIVVPSGVTQ